MMTALPSGQTQPSTERVERSPSGRGLHPVTASELPALRFDCITCRFADRSRGLDGYTAIRDVTARKKVEQERDDAIAARQEAEERLREVLAAKDARKLSPASSMPTNDPAGGSDKVKQTRRRGRPAKSDQSEAEFVEWWKPGWRDRIR